LASKPSGRKLAYPHGEGRRRVTIANHKSIVPKTLQSMLRQAGLSVEEFVAAL